jgi:hypothetical protein
VNEHDVNDQLTDAVHAARKRVGRGHWA